MLPTDADEAARYRRNMNEDEVRFDAVLQRTMISELLHGRDLQHYRVHVVATDATHVHALVSWDDDRPWATLRAGIKSSLSRRLNRDLGRHRWLSRNASRKRVRDREHFDYHRDKYLPRHDGIRWDERTGWAR